MTVSRGIPLSLHGALETIAGPAIMAAPFFLSLGEAASVVAFVFGAILLGLSLQVAGPTRAVPISAHAGLDYLLSISVIVAAVAIGIATGEWSGPGFLAGVGAAHVMLTASTRWSVPLGA